MNETIVYIREIKNGSEYLYLGCSLSCLIPVELCTSSRTVSEKCPPLLEKKIVPKVVKIPTKNEISIKGLSNLFAIKNDNPIIKNRVMKTIKNFFMFQLLLHIISENSIYEK